MHTNQPAKVIRIQGDQIEIHCIFRNLEVFGCSNHRNVRIPPVCCFQCNSICMNICFSGTHTIHTACNQWFLLYNESNDRHTLVLNTIIIIIINLAPPPHGCNLQTTQTLQYIATSVSLCSIPFLTLCSFNHMQSDCFWLFVITHMSINITNLRLCGRLANKEGSLAWHPGYGACRPLALDWVVKYILYADSWNQCFF